MEAVGQELHSEQWWAQFLEVSESFDAPIFIEGLADLIGPRIGNPLLRREVELAAETVVRHLTRPANEELAEQSTTTVARLLGTLERLNDRSLDAEATIEAAVVCDALRGRYAAAAAAAEPYVGRVAVQRLFIQALRLQRFDVRLTMRLLEAGRSPQDAVRCGHLVGRYQWWPSWLLQIITERAMAGTLDESTVAALDNCAYASLSPLQSHLARKLLSGDPRLIGDAVRRLEGLGESDAAERLRRGDLNTVALAARLMST